MNVIINKGRDQARSIAQRVRKTIAVLKQLAVEMSKMKSTMQQDLENAINSAVGALDNKMTKQFDDVSSKLGGLDKKVDENQKELNKKLDLLINKQP